MKSDLDADPDREVGQNPALRPGRRAAGAPNTRASRLIERARARTTERLKARESARRYAHAVNALTLCHMYPHRFQPWKPDEGPGAWIDRMDWSEYANSWVRETWINAADAIRTLSTEEAVEIDQLLDLDSQASDEGLRDRIEFVGDLFRDLCKSDASDAMIEPFAEGLGAAIAADPDAWESFHHLFEALASFLNRIAGVVAGGDAGTTRHTLCSTRERIFVTRAEVARLRGLSDEVLRSRNTRGQEEWPKVVYHQPEGKKRKRAGWWLEDIVGHEKITPEIVRALRQDSGYAT